MINKTPNYVFKLIQLIFILTYYQLNNYKKYFFEK
jgi:hypothetical protein